MQKQQHGRKIYRSKVWQKWQKTKAKYQQERRVHTDTGETGFPNKSQSPIITQYTQQCSKNVKTEEIEEKWDSNVFPQMRRISYWQFLKKKGEKCGLADIGWVKVGHPHSYYISLSQTPKQRLASTLNSYMPSSPIKNSYRQSVPSRPMTNSKSKAPSVSQNNSKTQIVSQSSPRNGQNKFVYHKPQMHTIAGCQGHIEKPSKIKSQIKNINGIISTPALPLPRRRKMSNGFQCRPWSGAIQESMIEYLMARTHGNLHS